MTRESDLTASLPEPPPPRPDAREATIAAAMRRFDTGDTGPKAVKRPQPRWAVLGRPQLGALAAAALVVSVGLPLWMSGALQSPPSEPRRQTTAVRDTPERDRPKENMAAAPASPGIAPPPIVAMSPAPAGPSPETRERSNETAPADVARTSAPPAVVAAIPEALPPPLPPPPPPPPPPAPAAMADAADQNIVVTAARVRPSNRAFVAESARAERTQAARGDWNACTVDDPDHRLEACRTVFAADRPAALLGDAVSHAWQGDTDAAITAFDRAIALSPRFAAAYLNRGLARAAAGDDAAALADLDRAVRFAPNAARSYYHRSVILRRRGDARRAEADERRAIRLDQRYTAALR